MLLEARPTLTIGIPADRSIDWTERMLSKLDKPAGVVEVLVARWVEKPLDTQDLQLLNSYFPTMEVKSKVRHAPAMRNAIVRLAHSSHILFLDDDTVPEPNLLEHAFSLSIPEPNAVYQGIPYHVANSHNWLARIEGKLYEKSFNRYLTGDNVVGLLDARLMLAPVKVLLERPFNESITFGGGEGHELARRLRESGVPLRLAPELLAAHINRETIIEVIAQKRVHGRGRGYMLSQDVPGENGWLEYIRNYFHRHLIGPVMDWRSGELNKKELVYVWGTYTVLWLGVLEEIVRSKIKPKA